MYLVVGLYTNSGLLRKRILKLQFCFFFVRFRLSRRFVASDGKKNVAISGLCISFFNIEHLCFNVYKHSSIKNLLFYPNCYFNFLFFFNVSCDFASLTQ